MGKLLEMVDILIVTDKSVFIKNEYEFIKRVDSLLEFKGINICNILKYVVADSKYEFLDYLQIVEKILSLDCTTEKYKVCIDKIEGLRRIRGKLFISDRYNFMHRLVYSSDWYEHKYNSIDEMIDSLDKFKFYELHHSDDSIYINNHKYTLLDVRADEYVYKQFIGFGNCEKIKGNIGLMIVRKDGRIEYYRDDVIKCSKDKVKIINKIGFNNIDLIVTRIDYCGLGLYLKDLD